MESSIKNDAAQVKSPYPPFYTKAARLAFFKEKLGKDSAWAIRAMERIYEFQTNGEKVLESTEEDNGVGFTGTDAAILSSFCKQIALNKEKKAKGQFKFDCFLSPKQVEIVLKKMPKYSAQLISALGEKAPPVIKAEKLEMAVA